LSFSAWSWFGVGATGRGSASNSVGGWRPSGEWRVEASAIVGCFTSATIDACALTPAVLAFVREAT
jgi:hypothetical protein